MVTPFDKNGNLDLAAWRRLLRRQVKAGIAGVIPCGTTGEAPALTLEEKETLIGTALEEVSGSRTQVIAGTGSNNAALTIETSKRAAALGVDGILVVTPYYNKPSQAGMLTHFLSVADAVDCQVVPYNVPSRTGVCLEPETIAELAAHPRITALKEATGSMAFAANVMDHLFQAGRTLNLLSGDDATFFPFLCMGGVGCISVTSNLCPGAVMELYNAAIAGNLKRARDLNWRHYPLFRDLFLECNPVPIKYALSKLGLCLPTVRPPLAELLAKNAERLDGTLASCSVGIEAA